MKKNMTLLLSLFTVLFAISATAEGNFITVPTSEDEPLRLFIAIDANGGFSAPQLKHMQGVGSVVYGVGSGFDVGFSLHGGVSDPNGLFIKNDKPYALVGADVMLRFLGNVTDMFFMGIQATVGYDYDWSGVNPKLASTIPVAVGLALGVSFADVAQLYLFPQFNFGGRASNRVAAVAPATDSIWGKEIGMSLAVGTWINMAGTKLVIEARPEWVSIYGLGNFKSDNFTLNGLIGLAWDM